MKFAKSFDADQVSENHIGSNEAIKKGPAIWCSPPEILELVGNEVHVWCVPLVTSPRCTTGYQSILSTDEQERVLRFVYQKDREQFITCRGKLRVLIARYLKSEPSGIRFYYSKEGKPALAQIGNMDLRFNVSHSDGIALYAFTRDREVGVDVERIRPVFTTEEIAERFFAPGEVSALRSLPPETQENAFFGLWTLKEAYVKASGRGLSLPFNNFEVISIRGEAPAFVAIGSSGERLPWSLAKLNLGYGYAAALAVEGYGCSVKCWRWKNRDEH